VNRDIIICSGLRFKTFFKSKIRKNSLKQLKPEKYRLVKKLAAIVMSNSSRTRPFAKTPEKSIKPYIFFILLSYQHNF